MRIAHNRPKFIENVNTVRKMEDVIIIDFNEDQLKTIELAFNAEHLKDALSLKKHFDDDYDFNFDDE